MNRKEIDLVEIETFWHRQWKNALASRTDTWHQATDNWSELCAEMGCRRVFVPGALVHVHAVQRSGTFYNFALVQDPTSFSVRSVEQIFAQERLPFAIRMPRQSCYAGLEKSLPMQGYTQLPIWILMRHEEDSGQNNPEVKVEEIGPSRLMDWFASSNLSTFQRSSKTARQEMIRAAMLKGSTRLFLAILDDKPVGVGLSYLRDRVASIHLMATVPEFRRRHVATTIVLATIDRLKNEKVDLIWLRTRKGGIGEMVYAKAGFKQITDILSYTRTPNLEDGIEATSPKFMIVA